MMAGIAVGGTVALGALLGGPVSGASMNPARSLGPALARVVFSLGFLKACEVGAVCCLNPAAFFLGHEVHVCPTGREGLGSLEERPCPLDDLVVVGRRVPAPVTFSTYLASRWPQAMASDATRLGAPAIQPMNISH